MGGGRAACFAMSDLGSGGRGVVHRQPGSIVDSVTEDAVSSERALGPCHGAKVSECVDSVRDVEQRMGRAEARRTKSRRPQVHGREAKIDRYHVWVSRFLEEAAGDGQRRRLLLGYWMEVYGGGMGNGNFDEHTKLRCLVGVGGGIVPFVVELRE